MTEPKPTSEPSFEEEVDAFLAMDPKERSQQIERMMAERIVYYDRRKRGAPVPNDEHDTS